jgi:tetratricopeptide (TPR) repeat protein
VERGRFTLAVDRLQTLVATGQFLAAYREVERMVMDPAIDPSLKAKLFIIGVRAAAGLREVYTAAKMAEKAVEAAELGSDWDDIGNARLYSALIYREIGDTAQALRFFQLFFQYLDRYPALQTKTAHAYYNLGLTHQQCREYDKALHAYELATEDFKQQQNERGILFTLQNMAWTLLLQRRIKEAEPVLSEAEVLSTRLEIPKYQVSQLVVAALYARLTANANRAVALCEEIFQPGRQGKSERHCAEAAWIMASITLEANRLQEAAIFADLAMSYALQAKEPHVMNLASEVRQQVLTRKSELPA